MALRYWDYLRSAFNARPMGMWAPPNWVGIAGVVLGGFLNPGIWIIGAGAELGYLLLLSSNGRFQRLVDAKKLPAAQAGAAQLVRDRVASLSNEDQGRYRALEKRCQTILERQGENVSPDGITAQGQGLGRLLWIYLGLLLMKAAIDRVMEESDDYAGIQGSLTERVDKLQTQVKSEKISDDLRKSLQGQLEILQQRQEKQREARTKLAFLEAELARIQEQVELIREQAVLVTDPETVSERIDQIAATLGGTTQWIQEQQHIYGQVEDLLNDPPPITVRPMKKESA